MQALSEAEIREMSARLGPPRGNHARMPVDLERVRAMRAVGFSMRQIGAHFDVSRATIYRRLREGKTRYTRNP